MEIQSESDNEDFFDDEETLENIKTNKLGNYGEEIFVMKNANEISFIANSDRNEFIDRFSENIFNIGRRHSKNKI
jgi:hypothetical protein